MCYKSLSLVDYDRLNLPNAINCMLSLRAKLGVTLGCITAGLLDVWPEHTEGELTPDEESE